MKKYTDTQVKQVIECFNSNKFKTSKEIGDYLNVPDFFVRRTLNSKDLFFGHFTPFGSKPPIEINVEFEQFIVGSLLGDGSLSKNKKEGRKSCNSKLTMQHSSKQKDYVLYKKSILDTLNIKNTIESSDQYYKPRNITYSYCTLSTLQNVSLNKYRESWYTETEGKQVPNNTKLSPLSIAIWFMDDGTIAGKTAYYLCTNSFNTRSLSILQEELLRFGIETNLHVAKLNQKTIYIKKKSVEKFNSIILPYICDSMKYKIITK